MTRSLCDPAWAAKRQAGPAHGTRAAPTDRPPQTPQRGGKNEAATPPQKPHSNSFLPAPIHAAHAHIRQEVHK